MLSLPTLLHGNVSIYYNIPICAVSVDVTTLKMARKPVKIQRKVQQDALGKVNRIKEISRRE